MARDARMSEPDEELDGFAGTGPIVDVDAGDVDVGKGALEHDRQAVADEVSEGDIVDARARDDQSVGPLRSEQVDIGQPFGRERLDEHPVARRSGRSDDAPERLGEERVHADLFR